MARDTSFSYSFLVLPPAEQREAIGVVWDFCRAVDDAVDEAPDAATAAAEVARSGGREVDRVFGADAPLTPQGRAPQAVRVGVSRCRASRSTISSTASRWICTDQRYETFDELAGYCRRVASAVGLICIEIFGCRDSRSRDYAFNLGLALQLTNIIRDVGVDFTNGRVYLPQEDLARFGVTEDDIRAGKVTEPMRRLLAHECERARQFFTAAAQAMPPAEARRLVAAEIMGGIYFEILQRIERRGYDVFTEVIRVPKIVRARIALTIWARDPAVGAIGFRRSARA